MVSGRLRGVLWFLGALAVVWLVSGLAMLPGMSHMMGAGMMNGGMMDGGIAEGGMMRGMSMSHMMAMMAMMAAQLLAMLGLLGILVYLVIDTLRRRPSRSL